MNYIQILYLCILKQRSPGKPQYHDCCELHSNLVSLHSETTLPFSVNILILLWITFKSCIFAFWNNLLALVPHSQQVVNYIQILYLCILKQPTHRDCVRNWSCELHSNLVSLHSETTATAVIAVWAKLWITFKSCIFAFWNN